MVKSRKKLPDMPGRSEPTDQPGAVKHKQSRQGHSGEKATDKGHAVPVDRPADRKSHSSKDVHKPGGQEQGGVRREDRNQPISHRSSRGKRSVRDNELRRYILLLSIPMIALILVIVTLVSGNFRNSAKDMVDTSMMQSVEPLPENTEIPVIEPDTKEYFHDFGGSILSQDTLPEINQLMEQYFMSISDIDMETFLHLFTSQDTSEEERYRNDFEKQKQYVEGYGNISCYTTPGPEEESYAVYVYYEIKYADVDTPAPSLVGPVYVQKGEDGVYRIYDLKLTAELKAYMDQLSMNEDVRLLISQVDQKAEDAMVNDPALNERILYMKQGPDYMREETSSGDGPDIESETTGESDP